MAKRFFFCLFLFISTYSFGQNIVVQGQILDSLKKPIEKASVVAFSIEMQKIIDYTYSDLNGKYQLFLQQSDFPITLRVSSLGYMKEETTLPEGYKKTKFNFILKSKVEKLEKVVLKSWQKIKIDRDTITFRVSEFTDGTEQVVEDLLKNIPGVEITTNGLIKVNGKPIDKLLIEGDDLFEDRYKLLSKNLGANYIDKVQILNNFEDNPVKKNFQKYSQKVALNLLLKDNVKNVWFGNVRLAGGSQEKYEGQTNLGLLKDKIKFFDLANANNTGKLSSSQIECFGSTGITNFNEQEKEEEQSKKIVDIDNISASRFSENEDVFNNSFLNTLSFVTDLSENTSLRGLTYYSFDNIDKQNTQHVRYFLPSDTTSFFEQNRIETKDISLATEFELKHLTKNRLYLTYNLSFEKSNIENNSSLFLNDNSIPQSLKTNQYHLYNHLNITKQISEKNLVKFYAYSGISSNKQKYNTGPFLFQQIFFNEEIEKVEQKSYSPLEYHGIDLEIKRKTEKSVYGLSIHGETRKTKINSSLFFDTLQIDSLSNSSELRNTKLTLSGKYSYFITEKIFVRTAAHFSKTYSALNNAHSNYLYFDPEIRLRYIKKGVGNFGLFYSKKTRLPTIENLHDNYLLKNYRTFSKGTEKIEPIKKHTIGFTYQFSNYKKQFLINTSLLYSISDKSYAQKLIIGDEIDFKQDTILGKRKFVNYNLYVTRYLEVLSSSLKLGTSQNWIQSPSILNNTPVFLKNYSSIYRLQGTTYFDLPINFDFAVQYNYSEGKFRKQRFSTSFWQASLDGTCRFSKNWAIELNNTFYNRSGQNYLFSDIIINYTPEKSNWSYRFTANNIANIKKYEIHDISEFQESRSSFQIVPRYFLLSVKYRF